MILNNTPVHEAVLSNVSQISTFAIKATAKSFHILSSGLYANKVRAIIRELSCNAVDSHAVADKKHIPFAVHLPNSFEPWFSVRDFGIGLSHAQVTQIYTTYFESTKTGSNDFIGALGLGSKSPFSYTDNFSVTAIQDGQRGIYSAFINSDGLPSIVLMMQEDTIEADGVEVKFSVNNRHDFYKFEQEAQQVYTHFVLRPIITGVHDFKFIDKHYETLDIIPGVHSLKYRPAGMGPDSVHYSGTNSLAVMGNIAYPIDIPESDRTLGDLRLLLGCGLEIHFDIGDLDFQASREGLSYIPQTLESIKHKLIALAAQLTIHVVTEANKIENYWTRAVYLEQKFHQRLWRVAVKNYVVDTKFPLFNDHDYVKVFNFPKQELADQYNLVICAFQQGNRGKGINLSPNKVYDYQQAKSTYTEVWRIPVHCNTHFVVNDTKIGASQRARYHYLNNPDRSKWAEIVYVLDIADRTKPGKFDDFFKSIYSPPSIIKASDLLIKPREERAKNVTILQLDRRHLTGITWSNAGAASTFDDDQTHYYMPLSGYALISDRCHDAKELYSLLKSSGIAAFNKITVHGVRKADIEHIKTQKNWINLEDFIAKELAEFNHDQMNMKWIDMNCIDTALSLNYNNKVANHISNSLSPYVILTKKFTGVTQPSVSERKNMNDLFRMFGVEGHIDKIKQLQTELNNQTKSVFNRYPLLRSIVGSANPLALAEYINLIDADKGI